MGPGSEGVDHAEEDPRGSENGGAGGGGSEHDEARKEETPGQSEPKPPIKSPTEKAPDMSEPKILDEEVTLPSSNPRLAPGKTRRKAWEPANKVRIIELIRRQAPAEDQSEGPLVSEDINEIGNLTLEVLLLSPNATLPTRGSERAAGLDLYASQYTSVPARKHMLVKTDISIKFPDGMYARIAPRSGLALRHGIDVGAGVIDQDYTGPIGIILFNHGDSDFEIKIGDRIAHLILEGMHLLPVKQVLAMEETARGSSGFGSTGVEKEKLGRPNQYEQSGREVRNHLPQTTSDDLQKMEQFKQEVNRLESGVMTNELEQNHRESDKVRQDQIGRAKGDEIFAGKEWNPEAGKPEPSAQDRIGRAEGADEGDDMRNLSIEKHKRSTQNGSDPQPSGRALNRLPRGTTETRYCTDGKGIANPGIMGELKDNAEEQDPTKLISQIAPTYIKATCKRERLTHPLGEAYLQIPEATNNLPQSKHPGRVKPGLALNPSQKQSPTCERCSLWSKRRMDQEKEAMFGIPVNEPPVGDLLRAPLPPPKERVPGLLVADHLVPLQLHPARPAEGCYFASGVTIVGGTTGPHPYVHQGRAFVLLLNSSSIADDVPNKSPPPDEGRDEGFVVIAMDTDSGNSRVL